MPGPTQSASVPPLRVAFELAPGQRKTFSMDRPFRIGRVDDCDICITSDFVSRHHAEAVFEDNEWYIRDLQSRNGIYVDGQRTDRVPVRGVTKIRFGIEGPMVYFASDKSDATAMRPLPSPAARAVDPDAPEHVKIEQYIDRYFNTKTDTPVGEHTMMVRHAFSKVQKKQKRKYYWVVAALSLIAVGAGGYAYYQYKQAGERQKAAQDIFYQMKSIDIDIANVRTMVANSDNPQAQAAMRNFQERRQQMEENYDRFLRTLRVYDAKVSPEDRLILRVARIFGECELAAPPDFLVKIKEYIGYWKSTGRLAAGLKVAQANGYIPFITKQLLAQDLPPQFLYLALQESGFDQYTSGPETRFGIAKGMWQFIPETGARFGLKIGPLVDMRRPDPLDDRHKWELATVAASKYLKELYTTDAQASGFLVMACYNWGEGRIVPLVRSLPANPRERNFWKLLARYGEKVPDETYKYVFYIVSAAVIGENPQMFGFNFENPLAHLENK